MVNKESVKKLAVVVAIIIGMVLFLAASARQCANVCPQQSACEDRATFFKE